MIIDVSEHNGSLNWEKLKPEIEGAIIRCGFGSDYTKQDDAYFKRNVEECTRLNIPFGVYIYSYANTEAKARSEAAHVKRLVKGLKLSLPIFYDLEEEKYSSYASKAANIWLKEMDGYDVGIYASVYWWKNYLTGVSCSKKWVAYWGSTQPTISGMCLWQYSDKGKVAGVSGLDLNKNINLPIPAPTPTPTPTPATVDITLDVLSKGSTGGQVKTIQMLLNEIGFRDQNGKKLANDGIFGDKTQYALTCYQKARGLTVDGICGYETWNRILK